MSGPAANDRLKPSEQVIVRELSGESVLLDLQSGRYFGLNAVGTRTWTLMLEGRTLREVGDALCDEFDGTPAVIRAEIMRFADELCNNGLCRIADSEVRAESL